jgi:NADH:ubiquinone oxidoreductase subunit 6 (subunit J)
MEPIFIILAALIIAASVAAMTLRNLVHCALALTVAFAGLAAVFLQLDAQFVGFAQILVYVGAVAILIVFAVLLTRGGGAPEQSIFATGWFGGLATALAVLAALVWALRRSHLVSLPPPPQPEATVKQIGNALMSTYILPLEVIGLLLTAALIGAVIIALKEEKK